MRFPKTYKTYIKPEILIENSNQRPTTGAVSDWRE